MKENFLQKWLRIHHFEMYPIEADFLNQLLEDTPIYKMALKKPKTKRFFREIDERLTGKIPSNFNTMMIGPPGRGKSLLGSDIIFTSNGIIKIEDMFNNIENFEIVSLNKEKFKTELKKIPIVTRHKCKENLIKITTKTGRTTTATKDHSFLVFDGHTINEIKGGDLKNGDFVPIAFNIKLPENKEDIEGFKLDWDFGFFIGAFLAEGCLTQKDYGIIISNQDFEFKSELNKFVRKMNLKFNDIKRISDNRIYNKRLYEFLFNKCYDDIYRKEFCKRHGKGFGSEHKIIPNFAFFAPNEFKRGILCGLFSGDGSISSRDSRIEIISKSDKMILGINILLNSIGIATILRVKKSFMWKYIGREYRMLKIDRSDLNKFIDLIGFKNTFKNKIMIRFKAKKYQKTMNSSFKFIPLNRTDVGHSRGYSTFEGLKAQIKRQELNIEKLKEIINGDVFFDKVVSIEEIPSDEYVYDLEVPDNENFMLANSMFVHNSYGMLYLIQYEMEKMGKEMVVEKQVDFNKTRLQIKLSKIIREELGTSIEKFLKSGKLVRIKTSMGLDEDVSPGGKGRVIEDKTQLNIEETVRQAQICFNYCSPRIKTHIYTQILDFFAINFEKEMNVAWLINPKNFKPIGIVYVGMASANIVKTYEMMKGKFLSKAGRGQFGGGRVDLKKEIVKELIKEHYDDLKKCSFKRDQMQIIEEIAEGRTIQDEWDDIYSRMVMKIPELDRRPRRRIRR